MAYLDLAQLRGRALSAPPGLEAAEGSMLTPLEWQVVALAQRDRLSSLEAPSRWSRFFALFFGGDRASPRLADARLETLRRIAVLAWHGGSPLPEAEVAAFHAAGYSLGQLQLVLARVALPEAGVAR